MSNLNFLLDENICEKKLKRIIKSAGFNFKCVIGGPEDREIAHESRVQKLVVVTRDIDFIDVDYIREMCYGILYIDQNCKLKDINIITALDKVVKCINSCCKVIVVKYEENCTAKCL